MRARRSSPTARGLGLVLGGFLVATPVAAAPPSPSAPPGPQPLHAGLYLATGDQVEGWSWLRDPAGDAYATWSFFGSPTGEPVVVELHLLATDRPNGEPGIDGLAPGVDGRAWVSIGPIVDGTPGPASLGPLPLDLPTDAPAGGSQGFQTAATVTIAPDELGPDVAGVWVLVERRGPTGAVMEVQLGAARDAVTMSGLAPAPRPEASPSG
jgi:hypothetical protein